MSRILSEEAFVEESDRKLKSSQFVDWKRRDEMANWSAVVLLRLLN